jgi:hypothetical protein
MTRTALILTCMALPLAACAAADEPESTPPPPAPPPVAQCDAEPAQAHVGMKVSSEAGALLLQITGSTQMRWIPPRTAVTMDYRQERLNVSYDDNMMIERIYCG